MKKVRLVRLVIQPDLVSDEEGMLMPLSVQPIQVTAVGWKDFTNGGFDAMVADLERQLNTAAPASGTVDPNDQ